MKLILSAFVHLPGHLAQPSSTDGNCFRKIAGLEVQLGLDSGCGNCDLHNGSETAGGFYRHGDVFTVASPINHSSWGESHLQEVFLEDFGEGEGYGFSLNVLMPNGNGGQELVVVAVQRFDLHMKVLVVGENSSTFDSNRRQFLTMEGY